MSELRTILFFISFFLSISLHAQKGEVERRLETLNYSDQLPEEILRSKTVVLLKVPPKGKSPEVRGDWRELSQTIQKGLHKAQIDAVVHYYWDDIFSGPEPYESFLNAFDDRNLSHAAIATFDGNNYSLTLLKMTDRQYLIAEEQDAWKKTGIELNQILNDLYRQAANSGLEKTNLLIIETPETGQIVDVIEGKRSEFYDLNLKSDKLAVPITNDTASIAAIMNEYYPFKWSFVNPDLTDKELLSQGFQFILYYVHTTGRVARELLKYPITKSETAFISEVIIDKKSQVVTHDANTPVFKFYIKNTRRRNTYIGKRWDAGLTISEGLKNYIYNLRNELIRN